MDEYKELFFHQLGRIEELARRLMERKFETARDLWTIQTDLVQLQLEIREEIRTQDSLVVEFKKKIADIAKSRKEDWKEALQELQAKVKRSEVCVNIHKHALLLAKQFGDALAWLFLKENEKTLFSLTMNRPNPSIPTGVSLQAMLAVAESYANAGAGFPIIHDITNCLRVGDLTFADPHNEDDQPLTVEVKAREPIIENDQLKSQVEVYATAYSPKFVVASAKLQNLTIENREPSPNATSLLNEPQEDSTKKHYDARLVRQLERMANAKALQSAQMGEPIEKLGADPLRMPLLPVRLEVQHNWFHWRKVRQLAEKAKVNGYATCAVDGAFFYAVTYIDPPTIYPWSDGVVLPYASEITEGVRKAFPFCADTEKNVICFNSTWDYLSGNVPVNVRPFFLYKLPADMRLDILWRRLSIIVYLNIGKIAEALEEVGISAQVPKSEAELNELFIPLTYQATLPDGSVVNIRGGNLNNIATKVAFEFMSLEGFVESVSQTIKTLIEVKKASHDVKGQSATE